MQKKKPEQWDDKDMGTRREVEGGRRKHRRRWGLCG